MYEDTLGPDFKAATGDNFGGPPCAGSLALAQEILSNEISPGVFLAIGAKAIKELFPKDRAKFAMSIAASPLVIGYSSKSRYYAQLNEIRSGEKPLSYLFTLLTTPGFKLGRTDPTQDTQGIFFILMTKLAQTVLHLPAGQAASALGITASSPYGSGSQMLSETALPTDIAEGIVDAGSEYLPEAREYGLDYITLPPTLDFGSPAESSLYSTVSLSVSGSTDSGEVIYVNVGLVSPKSGTSISAADEAADEAFVAFTLSSTCRNDLAAVGYELEPPVIHLATGLKTAAQALPASVLSLYNSLGGSIGS
jgi:molybdate/tungstate transport system substrate-binding protein